MRRIAAAALLVVFACIRSSAAQSIPAAAPAAEAIMAKVAANQDAAVAERAHYVYVQHAKTVSRHGSTVMCDELTDYRVTPAAGGSHEELLKVDGRMREKHRYVSYTTLLPDDEDQGNAGDKDKENGGNSKANSAKPDSTQSTGSQPGQAGKGTASGGPAQASQDDGGIGVEIGDGSVDRQLVENMRKNLMNDKSKDGLNAHLFPLTSKEQGNYTFQLIGQERLNGRDVFHVVFRPKDRQDFGWKGDAYIDAAAYQPVLVTTGMSRKIPFAVRTLLGTNFPGLGFTVAYAPQPDGVWFPVTFSTEFKIEVLFFFRRLIIIDAQNRDFEKTHVTTRILGEATPVAPETP
ncbi:MAG TPA: hypothetical protein VMD29_11040 [Terracidiphilus sp.]|nr:hypothetical protein [Terracidiphilus sp.]